MDRTAPKKSRKKPTENTAARSTDKSKRTKKQLASNSAKATSCPFSYVSWNQSAYGYQLKLSTEDKLHQPYFQTLHKALKSRNQFIIDNDYHPHSFYIKEMTPERSIKHSIRNGCDRYQFHRYSLKTRKYSTISRTDLTSIQKIYDEHASIYNRIVKLYNTAAKFILLTQLENELNNLEPALTLKFMPDLWKKCYTTIRDNDS